MRDIKKAKEAYVEGKQGKGIKEKTTGDVGKVVDEEMGKTKPTKQTWSDFINSIKCNY